MDLSKVLIDSMTSIDSLSALTSRSKATPTQVKNTIMSAVPGLLGAMEANTATEEGARDLLGALSQHTNSGSMRSQLAGADLVDGDKILSKILGEYKTDFLSQVSTYAGADFNQTRTILSCIAPGMLSSVAAANNVYNEPGARSGVDASYPGGTTRSEAAVPYGTNYQTVSPAAQAQAQAESAVSQLKSIVGDVLLDEDDKQILEGLKGKSLLENLKNIIL